MIAPTVSLYVVLAASVGMIHHGHQKDRNECVTCCEEQPGVQEQIAKLQSCSGWVTRRKAARALRKYDWKCHPEAVEALAGALLHDRQCLVRQEAAESLAKMKPRLPSAHQAVTQAARDDSSLFTRLTAKKALKAIGKSCVETCSACDSGSMPGDGEWLFPDDRDFLSPPPPTLNAPSRFYLDEPLAPASFQAPIAPTTISPFAPGSGSAVSERPPVPPPSIHLEDTQTLTPPMPGFDRYDPSPAPYHGEIQPNDFDLLDAQPPRAEWPQRSTAPFAPAYRRPNYASSLLGIQP